MTPHTVGSHLWRGWWLAEVMAAYVWKQTIITEPMSMMTATIAYRSADSQWAMLRHHHWQVYYPDNHMGTWSSTPLPPPVSDPKLYEIQASRACNFITFQAPLESSRSLKSLCQQSFCQRTWNSTFLTTWTTPKLQRSALNLIIFRTWLFSITLLYYP